MSPRHFTTPLNRATTIIDPRGDMTTMAYDAAGREIGLTDPMATRRPGATILLIA